MKAAAEAPTLRTTWPLYLIALGAFVAIWGGWVGLGELAGFGPVRLFPGIADDFVLNSAITLPLGMEAYAALALRWWLAPADRVDQVARTFAGWSVLGALVLGAAGQIAYHLMAADGLTKAPWQITAAVSCLPVIVLGCGAALIHLIHRERPAVEEPPTAARPVGDEWLVPVDLADDGEDDEPRPAARSEPETAEPDVVPTEEPTGRDEDPTEPADEYNRGLDSADHNDDLVDDLQRWAADRGRPPSRDDVIRAYGVGAGRARTLRKICGWPRGADEDADRSDSEPTAVGATTR